MSDDRNRRAAGGDRAPLREAGGCIVFLVCVWFEVSIGVAIAAVVAQAVAPALAARGYNVRVGSGFMIAVGLGAVIAIYPVTWLHRLGRMLRDRLGLQVR